MHPKPPDDSGAPDTPGAARSTHGARPTHGPRAPRGARVLDALGLPVSRSARRAFGYAVAGLVPALLGVPLLALVVVGGALCMTRLGPPLLGLVLTAARGPAAVQRVLVRVLLGEDVPAPARPAVRRAAYDAGAWRTAGFCVVSAPLALVLLCVALPVRVYALAALTYPLWFTSVRQDGHVGLSLTGEVPLDTLPRALLVAAAGLALLAGAGWTARRLTALVKLLARTLLGPGRLAGRIHDLEETRALAVRDAAATLRRIERDLHDGAQARLVAVAMGLTRARAALGPAPERTDTDKARALVEQSLDGTRTALAELRDLVRGIHPPVLDNGLVPALASLRADVDSPETRVELRTPGLARAPRPPEAVETIAYFCAAELLTNAARHAHARTIRITATRTGPEAAGPLAEGAGQGPVLEVTVEDDGRGGAVPSSGLLGLRERVRTIDGTLTLTSPPGGPTRASVRLPLPEEPAPCAS